MKHLKTIAIIGAAEPEAAGALKFLLNSECHLLLLAQDQTELRRISKILKNEKPVAGISLIDCIKEGCWEADAVVIAVPEAGEKEIAMRIREVVTQKIVISMKIADTIPGNSLQQLLPNSKVVAAKAGKEKGGEWNLIISGGNEAALNAADELLNSLNIRHSVAA